MRHRQTSVRPLTAQDIHDRSSLLLPVSFEVTEPASRFGSDSRTVGVRSPVSGSGSGHSPLTGRCHDILGHAPTGTGKTAAFALPLLLSRLDLKKKHVQIMVLAPTRELAIQVAEAFKTYAANIKGFQVLPIYGGQDYGGQIRGLKRGVHVVVGTPGSGDGPHAQRHTKAGSDSGHGAGRG